jgi:CRISPR-associated endonuclease/helicase Cas3
MVQKTKSLYYRYWGKSQNKHESKDCEPYHLLVYHSLDVAAVGYVLLNKHVSLLQQLSDLTGLEKEAFKQWAVFFLSLHDIGKFADSFQALDPDTLSALQHRTSLREYSERHDSLGFFLWKKKLKSKFSELGIMPPTQKRGKVSREQKAIHLWMSAVTGHHGQPPQNINIVLNRAFEESDFIAVNEYIEGVYSLFCNNDPFPECDPKKLETASWWLSGFAVLCDWLGSNKEYFPYCHNEIPLDEYWDMSLKRAEKAVFEAGLLTATPTKELTLEQIIKVKEGERLEATPLQQMAKTIALPDSPHLLILEDVTGAGKTEAAVIFAHRLMQNKSVDGVYFALPTMATANAMYSRLAKAYMNFYEAGSKPSLILAHAASALSDEFSDSIMPVNLHPEKNYGDNTISAGAHCNQWLADNRKKALLADIGVGTIDQALLAILPSRHQSLRLLGLLNKVLIVDEVHACDAYMQELLCSLLKTHAMSGGSAILLSATLPTGQRQKLLNAYAEGKQWQPPRLQKIGFNDYPLLTSLNFQGTQEEVIDTRENVKRTVNVQLIHSQDKIEKLFSDVIEKGLCACWIRNTVIDARESFDWLKKKHPEWNIDLFHARFAMGDRLDIENRVLKTFGKNSTAHQRKGRILIATQVVEQSLDADWDEMVTDLVPIDMIIQRAGRLRRHTRDQFGNRVEGKDQRGKVILHVLSPELVGDPKEDWYAGFFKKAKYIYENHGQLWLTASLLKERGKFQMPEDARRLIEGVYGEDAELKIPANLLNSALDAEGTGKAETSIAKSNALKITAGYSDESTNRWWDEAITPTRLGEKTITLYLARWQNGVLIPWRNESKHAWSYSSVSVRTYWVSQTFFCDEISQKTMDQCMESLPAKGKWGVLIPLVEKDNDVWEGRALNEEGKEVLVQYMVSSGLVVK